MHPLVEQLRTDYIDNQLVVTIDKKPGDESTKNGLMHQGLTLCLTKALDILDIELLLLCRAVFFNCKIEYGIYARYPEYKDKPICPDASSHDDYIGIVAGSCVSDVMFDHYQVLDRGRHDWFLYNNVTPNKLITSWNPLKWAWWALRLRMPNQILWYYNVNGGFKFLKIFLQAFLFLKMKLRSEITYEVLLDYMMIESMAYRYKSWKYFRNYFVKNAKLSEAAVKYFKSEDHPLVSMCKLVEQNV